MTKTLLSLDDLDAVTAGDEAFEFPYILPNGSDTGITFKVLGAQSEKVTAEVNRLVNERRRKEASAEAQSRTARSEAVFTPVEDDVAFGQRLAAVRLVGWTGLKDEWSPANALRLCQRNADVSNQVTAKSNEVGNFMKLSPKA